MAPGVRESTAQRAAQAVAEQFRMELIVAQARRLSDTVAFYQSMGGEGGEKMEGRN
ncbi:MAG: hypothetical protein WBP54_01715 [Pelodictyon phaeoclathratiforme]